MNAVVFLFPMIVHAVAASSSSGGELPTSLDLTAIRAIVVQHSGRWPPLDTVARDLVNSVTGTETYEGHDPVLMLLAWTFDGPTWRTKPLIRIGNAELRELLELPSAKTRYSYEDLLNHEPLRAKFLELSRRESGTKLDPFESKVSDIDRKLADLGRAFRGQVILPIPDPVDIVGVWAPIPKASQTSGAAGASAEAWAALRTTFLADDAEAFSNASTDLSAALAAMPSAHVRDDQRVATELRYNRLKPYGIAWKAMAAGALLATLALYVKRRWFDVIAAMGLFIGFAVLTYGLSLRWTIAGRIPASNMFESLLFVSWGMGAVAVAAMLVLRHRLVPVTASFMGALSLCLADVLPMDSFIRPINPVLLGTVWMSIHVPVIMISYSVLAMAVLVAHLQLVVMAVVPTRRALADTFDRMHYWYIHVGSLLLLIGIVTGSMWAASSWGRYWGWDPKEVWSLVALLAYLAILHVRTNKEPVSAASYVVGALLGIVLFVLVVSKFEPDSVTEYLALLAAAAAMVLFVAARGQFATACKSIVAFWMILMTYLGVNYVLSSGLHSYGFGAGAMADYMLWAGGIDLAFVGACAAVYLIRRPATTPRMPMPQPA